MEYGQVMEYKTEDCKYLIIIQNNSEDPIQPIKDFGMLDLRIKLTACVST